MRVWLIDDDNVTNMLNRYFLEEHFTHLEINSFTKARLALNELMQSTEIPDVIFLDINMPEMNGWEFLEELSSSSLPKLPEIYLLSSSVDPSDELNARSIAKVKGFISKPLEYEKISLLALARA